ncbi:MFS transporter [Leptolyngbya sp. 15MV]|nr:MFS transporter [Leptolyngbya sp. 15MV]
MNIERANPIRRFWQRYRGLPPTVFALSLVSFLNDTSSEIIYPLLPAFLFLALGATPFAIGLIEGIAESLASILKLFSGYLSDKFAKRKLPVFLGYSLAAIMRPLLAFVTSWQQVLVVRMTDRVGKGIRGAPRDALLAAEVPEDRRGMAFGFNRAADHLGAVVGPIVAFMLLTYLASDPENPTLAEYQSVFLYASIPVAVGLFVIVFFVHEPKKPAEESAVSPKLSLDGFDGSFKRYPLILALFTLSNSTDAFLLLRAEQAGVAPAMLPLLWMVLHFSKVFSSLVGGELSDSVGRKAMIISGWVVYSTDAIREAGVELDIHDINAVFPALAQAIMTSDTTAQRRPAVVRGFVQAVLRAVRACMDDPAAAARDYVAQVPQHQGREAAIERIIRRYATEGYPQTPPSALGRFDPARLEATQRFYLDNEIVRTAVPVADLFSNDFAA